MSSERGDSERQTQPDFRLSMDHGVADSILRASVESVQNEGDATREAAEAMTDHFAALREDLDFSTLAWPEVQEGSQFESFSARYSRLWSDLVGHYGLRMQEDGLAALRAMRDTSEYLGEELLRAKAVLESIEPGERKKLRQQATWFRDEARVQRFILQRLMRQYVIRPTLPPTEPDIPDESELVREGSEIERRRRFPSDAAFEVFLAAWYLIVELTGSHLHSEKGRLTLSMLWERICQVRQLTDINNIKKQAEAGGWWKTSVTPEEAQNEVARLGSEIGEDYLRQELSERLDDKQFHPPT